MSTTTTPFASRRITGDVDRAARAVDACRAAAADGLPHFPVDVPPALPLRFLYLDNVYDLVFDSDESPIYMSIGQAADDPALVYGDQRPNYAMGWGAAILRLADGQATTLGVRDASCPILPIGARVIVRLVDDPPISSVLVTPDAHKPRTQRGVVAAVGTGREYPTTGYRIPAGVRLGELVVFTRYADERNLFGKFTGPDDVQYAALSQEEILCVLDADPAA